MDNSIQSDRSILIASNFIVITSYTLSPGKPSVFLFSNHLLKTGFVFDEWREDEKDVADIRNKVSEGAIKKDWRDLSGVDVDMNTRNDRLRLAINFPLNSFLTIRIRLMSYWEINIIIFHEKAFHEGLIATSLINRFTTLSS